MTRFMTTVFLVLLGLPALATPPDAISISDRIFGVNATHVFILRHVNDNLGLNILGMNDTYLVAKSIKTGQDETIWPVMRWHRGYDENGEKQILQYFPLAGAINPFRILAQFNALPINRPMRYPDERFTPQTALFSDGLEIAEQILPLDVVFAQMRASIDLTSAAFQPYPETGFQSMTFSTPQDMMGDIELEFEWCEIEAAMSIRASYDLIKVNLARIYCAGDSAQSASLIVLIPAGKAEN